MNAAAVNYDGGPRLPHPLVGRVLGNRYRIVGELGEGGMGMVFSAEQLRLKRNVAIKMLAPHLSGDRECLQRFYREAEVMSRMAHPHVVGVLDFDVANDGSPYLVLELLAGETLSRRLERYGRFEPREAVRVVDQVASALAAAHACGVVHRDLKPDNVFLVQAVGSRDFVKLLDFGISKDLDSNKPRLTQHHALLGTPNYMAPEQVMSDDAQVDGRCDQYALGAIAYELLAGAPPFENDNVYRLFQDILNAEPPSVGDFDELSDDVDAVLRRALAKKPEDRFASVTELAEALRHALRVSEADVDRSTPRPPRTAPPGDERLVAAESGAYPPVKPDLTHEIVNAMDGARAAFEDTHHLVAWKHAERALTLAEQSTDPAVTALFKLSRGLLNCIYTARPGRMDRRLEVRRVPSVGEKFSPQLAFVVSRLDGGLTVGEVLDLSPLPRFDTMRALTKLLGEGILAVA